MSKRIIMIVCALGVFPAGGLATDPPNPYCVTACDWSPNGRMVKLGMPGGLNDWNGSLGYAWGVFSPYNFAAMTNPCYRWGTSGGPFHCYDVENDAIHDPVATQQWVLSNPGKVYLLGNEPNNNDLAVADGMTPAQYAQLYHKYYEFIRPLDPTAKFAVAGAYGDPYWISNNIEYWTSVLTEYRTRYGVDMPVDIWNNHCYESVGRLEPDHIINDFFIPFRQFVDTVSGGIYAGKEIWCTEFGVATWAAPLSPDYMAEFVEQFCPRLEASGTVNRFFWFIGAWEPPWTDSALLDASGQPTVAGRAYSRLANSYPNPIPPPPADPPPPVWLVESDFETDTTPWRTMGGDWVIDSGTYRQTRVTGAGGLRAHLPYWYTNVHIEADVRINAAGSPTNWVGLNLRGGTIWKEGRTRAYLVLLRQNGELDLYNPVDGTIAAVPGAVADTSVFHRLGVTVEGWHFTITLDGQTRMIWDDTHRRYASGFVGLETAPADCSFDNVVVQAYAQSDFDLDGDVDLTDFSLFQVCFGGPNRSPGLNCPVNADFDSDGDVDLADFARFQACFNGPNRPPACA